jgi:ABC-type sugar transport system ATPase subunit
MTTQQQNTIDRMVARIEKLNGKQKVVSFDIQKGHVILYVGNVINGNQYVRETIYCDVEINTKGNITKGFADALRPKEWVKYLYID